MSDYEKVSLATIGNGAAVERFNDALKEVLENLTDPNCDEKAIREITLKVKFKPEDLARGVIGYNIGIGVKMAPPHAVKSVIYAGKEKGEPVAYEQDIQQGDLPFDAGADIKEFKLKETKDND